MCCIFLTLTFLGPRVGFLVWWLLQPLRINAAFNTFIWPLLGLIFLPWTTLMYLIVFPGGVNGWDWLWIGLSVAADLATYTSGAYKRKEVPYYPSTAP